MNNFSAVSSFPAWSLMRPRGAFLLESNMPTKPEVRAAIECIAVIALMVAIALFGGPFDLSDCIRFFTGATK
jgi:hypothetical protein